MNTTVPASPRDFVILREDKDNSFSVMGFTAKGMTEDDADAEVVRLRSRFPHQAFEVFGKRRRKSAAKRAMPVPSATVHDIKARARAK